VIWNTSSARIATFGEQPRTVGAHQAQHRARALLAFERVEADLRRDAEMPEVARLRAARGADAVQVAGQRGGEPVLDLVDRRRATRIDRHDLETVEHHAVGSVEHARLLDRQPQAV
jgi:hypothetical protein